MPLILCPECNSTISDKAAACPRCGFPINQAEKSGAVFARPSKTVEHGEKSGPVEGFPSTAVKVRSRPDWKGRAGCLAVMLLCACLLAFAMYIERINREEYTPTAADAYQMAVMRIKDSQQARITVRFPPVDDVTVSRLGQNTYRFQSKYYIKDKSGEKSEREFTATVRYVGSGQNNYDDWSITGLRY